MNKRHGGELYRNRRVNFKAGLVLALGFTLILYLRIHHHLSSNISQSEELLQDSRKTQEVVKERIPPPHGEGIPDPPTKTSLEETLLQLPDVSRPPARGGVIIFQHVVKTGGTTIRENFKNSTRFPNVQYWEVFANSVFKKLQTSMDQKLERGFVDQTVFVEIHGRNTPTLVELAPHLKVWRDKARAAKVPFFAFTLLRNPVELAVSIFNQFHVFGDKRFGDNMPGTVENLRNHLQNNPQCLYLFRGERAYMRPRMMYNVTQEDCQQIQTLLAQAMDWVGDTRNLSKDTLPLLTYLVTGQAGLATSLGNSNVAAHRQTRYQPLSQKSVDPETLEMIRARSTLDQALYENAITGTHKLKELVSLQKR